MRSWGSSINVSVNQSDGLNQYLMLTFGKRGISFTWVHDKSIPVKQGRSFLLKRFVWAPLEYGLFPTGRVFNSNMASLPCPSNMPCLPQYLSFTLPKHGTLNPSYMTDRIWKTSNNDLRSPCETSEAYALYIFVFVKQFVSTSYLHDVSRVQTPCKGPWHFVSSLCLFSSRYDRLRRPDALKKHFRWRKQAHQEKAPLAWLM